MRVEIVKGRHRYVVAQCDCGVSQWARKSSVTRAERAGRSWSCPSCAHRANGALGGWLSLPVDLRVRRRAA